MNNFATMLGINTSENKTCFLGTTDDGMAVLVNGKEFFLRYADFPWFEYCGASELRDVTADRWGVYWNASDVDLPIEALEHPEQFPEKISVESWMKARSRNAARIMGQAKSERKAAASRQNGLKGGRPRTRKTFPRPTTAAGTSHTIPYDIAFHVTNSRNHYIHPGGKTDGALPVKVAACVKTSDDRSAKVALEPVAATLGRSQKKRQ